ncbi:MAG: hypothetical protein KF726_00565 [Anaerolineae bacterium]|nr:hypothetical protein [Anaerolineae bacterium]
MRNLKRIVLSIVVIVMLFGVWATQYRLHAASTYSVTVGMSTPYGIEVLAYGPQTLKIHRGDTVQWQFAGPHNVRFDEKPATLIISTEIDGKKVMELNPVALFPNGKDGEAHHHGAGSGIPMGPGEAGGPPTWSVVMDVEPGNYTYVCDLHPGMIGFITVVADSEMIATPEEVIQTGAKELQDALAAADAKYVELLKQPPTMPVDGITEVTINPSVGPALIFGFFPQAVNIQAGQSVTWKVPGGIAFPVTVNFPIESEIEPLVPVMDANGTPHFLVSGIEATIQSGSELPADGKVVSGLLNPGDSFTLKFTKPGRYGYYNGFGSGFGVVVVQPAPPPPSN